MWWKYFLSSLITLGWLKVNWPYKTWVYFVFLALFWHAAATAAAKSLQSRPTLCNPIDGSPPGSSALGILQARTLEWVAISFSNAWNWKVKVKSLSRVWLFMTSWTVAYQAPRYMGVSRQEYWSGVPLPSQLFWHDGKLIGLFLDCLVCTIDVHVYQNTKSHCLDKSSLKVDLQI